MPCRLGHRLYKLWTPRKILFNKVILIMEDSRACACKCADKPPDYPHSNTYARVSEGVVELVVW